MDQPISRLDMASIGLTLATLALAWIMSAQPVILPIPQQADSMFVLSPTAGVVFYSLLFAALTLLAYRMSYGLYAGFHHIAIIAVYLNFGPVAAVITAF